MPGWKIVRNDPELRKAENARTSALHCKRYHSDPEYRQRVIDYAKNRYQRIKAEKKAEKERLEKEKESEGYSSDTTESSN